jgi:hypothetical protein
MAMPILDRLGVPAAFYVTVDCVESRRLPWPSRLRYSFRKTARKEWKGEAAKIWNLGSEREREAAYLAACDRVAMLAGAEQERVVSHIEFDLGTMLPAQSGDLMMSWGQVRGLAQRGHIVGSHTTTHPNLAHVGVEDARRELVESKRRMESQINAKVDKYQTIELARGLGIAVPRTWLVKADSGMGSLPDLSYPVVVKDRFSVRWKNGKAVFGSLSYGVRKTRAGTQDCRALAGCGRRVDPGIRFGRGHWHFFLRRAGGGVPALCVGTSAGSRSPRFSEQLPGIDGGRWKPRRAKQPTGSRNRISGHRHG